MSAQVKTNPKKCLYHVKLFNFLDQLVNEKDIIPFLDERRITNKAYYSASSAMIERAHGRLRGALTCGKKISNHLTLKCILDSLIALKTAEFVKHLIDRIRPFLSEHSPIAPRHPDFSSYINPRLLKLFHAFVRLKRFRSPSST